MVAWCPHQCLAICNSLGGFCVRPQLHGGTDAHYKYLRIEIWNRRHYKYLRIEIWNRYHYKYLRIEVWNQHHYNLRIEIHKELPQTYKEGTE